MANEIEWRVVPGFPLYEVSSDGRLRSYRRKACKWRASHAKTERREAPIMLAGARTPLGYIAFMLRAQSGKPKRMLAHRVVALAFLPNPAGLSDVAHNDGKPWNNCVENLRWATHRDNQMDMRKHGTMQDGEKCVTAKITHRIAAEIRARCWIEGRGAGKKMAKRFGLSKAQVSRIRNGKRWACLDG